MELLFFLGQDTPLNIISDSSKQSKAMPPYINIHVMAGGVDVHQLEEFLACDNDIYDDLVYLSVPTQYMPAYQASHSVKWLMWRVHNDMCQALICDVEMYDKLRHKPMMAWLHSSHVVQELLGLQSPFARIATDTVSSPCEHICCFQDTVRDSSNKLWVDHRLHTFARKTFVGCLLLHHKEAPSYLSCDFVGYKVGKTEETPMDPHSYVYRWSNFVLVCKRPLSSIITSLSHLKQVQTVVVCEDLARPYTDAVVQTLEHMLVPFTLRQDSKELLLSQTKPTLYLRDTINIHNPSMFLSLLRKCPAFNNFDAMLLHPPSEATTFKYNMINDSFVYLNGEADMKAVLYVRQPAKVLLAPLVYPTTLEKLGTQQLSLYSPYYIECLGDHDLAEQMTQYASTVKAFDVVVNVHKEAWKLIKLKKVFQNIAYTIGPPPSNTFALSFQPTKHKYIFRSEILWEATKLLSAIQTPVVGIHFQRKRLGVSVSNPCSEEYYKRAIEAAKEHHKEVTFLVGCADSELLDNKIHHLLKGETVVKNSEDEAVALCAFTLCQSLILSTSSFAWWAAVLSNADKVWCPRKWINTSHWYHSHDFERKLKQDDWTVVDDDEDEEA